MLEKPILLSPLFGQSSYVSFTCFCDLFIYYILLRSILIREQDLNHLVAGMNHTLIKVFHHSSMHLLLKAAPLFDQQ